MNDAGAMRGRERLGDLYRRRQRLAGWERTAIEPCGKRLALDELHHEEWPRRGLLHSVQRGDVGMIEGGECLGFAREASGAVWVARHRIRQNLDRYDASKLRIARAIHFAHGARTKCPQDLVGTEALA